MEDDAEALRFSEMIDRIDREQLGKAIVIRDTTPESAQVRQSDAGIDIERRPQETKDTVIGISLALGEEKHLLVYKNGGMQVTQPEYEHEEYKE